MSEDRLDPPPPDSAASATGFLHPRREPFEHGLIPIPKLIFSDGTASLSAFKEKIVTRPCEEDPNIVDAEALAGALQISIADAGLVLETLASVLHSDPRPEGAHVLDLVLFLYIQSYKRLLPRTHKDSASVADVWPSTSAFDGVLSSLSPLQLVRSNSRRLMPSQADEEAYQLSYLQKHLSNILALLAESVQDDVDESLVLTLERFEHLGFLIQFGEKGSNGIPLSQAVPFFANPGPNMPAVPVTASQVHDWLLQSIAVSLEHTTEKVSAKEHGLVNSSDHDVTMFDTCGKRVQRSSSSGTSMHNSPTYCRIQTFVEAVSKASVVKQACDMIGHTVKVLNCHDSAIYVLAPLRYATVYGCSDATIFLGAIGKALRVEHCERVHIITAAKRICIANCRDCVFYLGVNQRPIFLGDNHKLQVAPFNTYYSQLEEHMAEVGVDSAANRWDEPLVLGMVDPHDSLSHPAGISDVQLESPTHLDPDQFMDFLIPSWFGAESPGSTKYNPFLLPEIYRASQKKKHSVLADIQQVTRDLQLNENQKRELACALHVHFKDWLYASGNIRQLYCLQGD